VSEHDDARRFATDAGRNVKLVDTSAWIEFLRGTKSSTDTRVQALLNSRDAAWCEIVVLELLNGASAGEVQRIERLRREVWHFEIDAQVWSVALNLAIAARASAITTPTVDLVVAACARVYDLQIEHHRDAHFEKLAMISI
jgi:predicted nucleic acid-binding protein